MTHLTLAIDDEVLQRAELRAQEQGTSLETVLRDYLARFAGIRGQREHAIRELLAASGSSLSRRDGRTWTRDELHER